MLFYRRRLPHWHPENADYFVTWRLAGSPPPITPDCFTAENTGRMNFGAYDEELARADTGPRWLSDPRIAAMVQDAIIYGQFTRKSYDLHAWVIMPNHVHVVFTPKVPLAKIMCWLKTRTARRANQMLGRIGQRFWQEESYDHWIRTEKEFKNIIAYVERNPVTAGFVESDAEWQWSSASRWAGDEKRSPALRVRS